MNKRFFAIMALAFLSSSANAAGNDFRHQKIFSKMKQVTADGIQGRIAILQATLGCVNAATNHEQLKSCRAQERMAMEAHNEKQKAEREALRASGGR